VECTESIQIPEIEQRILTPPTGNGLYGRGSSMTRKIDR
jgi:hypothetical protein